MLTSLFTSSRAVCRQGGEASRTQQTLVSGGVFLRSGNVTRCWQLELRPAELGGPWAGHSLGGGLSLFICKMGAGDRLFQHKYFHVLILYDLAEQISRHAYRAEGMPFWV